MALAAQAPAQPAPTSVSGGTLRLESLKRIIEERIVRHVSENEFEPARGRCMEAFDDFRRYRELFRGVIQRQHYDGLANVNIPLTLENVESITANIIALMFPHERWLKSQPGQGATDSGARQAEAILMAHLRLARVRPKLRFAFSQYLLLLGTLITKRGWAFDSKLVQQRVQDRMGGTRLSLAPKMTQDHADLNVVDLTSFYPSHVEAESIDDLDWMIERHVRSKVWLERRELILDENNEFRGGVYINLDQIGEGEYSDLPLRDGFATVGRDHIEVSVHGEPMPRGGNDFDTDKIEVLERWGVPQDEQWWPELEEDREARDAIFSSWGLDPQDPMVFAAEHWVVEVAAQRHLIRIEPNPDPTNELPYDDVRYIPLAGQFYGLGVAEIGESQHLMSNALWNQELDIRTKQLSGMKAIQASGLDMARMGNRWESALKWRPDGIVWTKRPVQDVIQDLTPKFNENAAREAIDRASDSYRRASGAVDIIQGQSGPGEQTATETQILANFAQTRLGMTHLFLEDWFAHRVVPRLFGMIQVWADRKQIVQIVGEQGFHDTRLFNPDDITGEIFFHMVGTRGQAQQAIYRQQVVAFASAVSNPFLAQYINAPQLTREMASVFEFREPEKIVFDPVQAVLNETDPFEENEVLLSGGDVQVKLTDIPQEHIPIHMEAFQQAMVTQDVSALSAIERHMRQHQRLLALQAQMQQQAMLTGGGGGPPGEREGPQDEEADGARETVQNGQLNFGEGF